MENFKYKDVYKIAQGLEKAELVLKNAQIINVFTKEIVPGDIALCNGIIVGIGNYSGIVEKDLKGAFVSPGFIDSHLHMESSMASPVELVQSALAWGTTTFIADPHEAANVKGPDGIDYMMDQTKNLPANIYFMLPSCVPALEFEDNGYNFDASKMKGYLNNPRILGLGEVMDYPAVLGNNPKMMDKIELFAGGNIDGHAPNLTDHGLNAYRLSGIMTDHECTDFDYALRERRLGFHIHIREGSAARNLESIVKGLLESKIDIDGFSFCTDDKHIENIRSEGHISYCVKKAIELGMSIPDAVAMASINAAKCYGLKNIGAIAPGYQGDLVVIEDFETMNILDVYFKGKSVSEFNFRRKKLPPGHPLKRSVNIGEINEESLNLEVSDSETSIIGIVPGEILTEHIMAVLPAKDGYFVPNSTFNKIAVIERHMATGLIGLGSVTGFGIKGGAIASTVSHDSHNLIVIGDNDRDMHLAIEELQKVQGGFCIVRDGKVAQTLALPIMGLMSDESYDSIFEKLVKMTELAHSMGIPQNIEPFVTMSFLGLPVIPKLRITPRGMFDVMMMMFT